jgi:hypothetical protein
MESRRYPTDLLDDEWDYIGQHTFPRAHRARTPQDPRPSGGPRRRLLRPQERLSLAVAAEGLPALEDRLRLALRRWRIDGTFERLNAEVGEVLRARSGRNRLPSAGIADSQAAKTTGVGGEQRGHDGGKKVRGRKRHLSVETEGVVMKAKVHSAKVPDQDGLKLLLEPTRECLPPLKHSGSMPAMKEGTGDGRRKLWALVWKSYASHRNQSPRR